ncbi:MAG TPA: DUF4190 domain-containing protein [Candidatus Nanoarchaeia archaeon]|nr:DUF4190 domain-containing protein [Candidatus Nanoarchaeia archaeon]
MVQKQLKAEKSKARAVSSFVLGLGFWIPLLNFILGALAVYHGMKALRNIKNEPKKYSGKAFAVTGIILGCLVYFLYLVGIGMCLYGFRDVCSNIGLEFLNK